MVLIFLMLSTTYSKFTELQISLPVANAEQLKERPQRNHRRRGSADGRYVIKGQPVEGRTLNS